MNTASITDPTIRSLLSIRNYRYLILSQLASNIGDGVYRLALIWLMKVLSESAFLMSILLAAETIPLILLGIFAGVFVDRGNKKKIMMLSNIFRALLLLLLIILLVNDRLHPFMLIAIAVMLTCLTAFLRPAITVSIRTIVPEEQMTVAQSLSQIIQTVVGLVAPALAALLIIFGMEFAFLFNVLIYFIGAVFTLFIRHQELEQSQMSNLTFTKMFADLKDGVKAITSHVFLRNCLVYFTLINFVTAPEALLLPLVVSNVSELAILEIGFFGGILLGSVCINYLKKYSPIVYICFGISLFSLGIGLFVFDIPIALQTICVFINGVGSAFVNIKMSTMITVLVPKEVLGRASSIINVVVLSAMPISTFLTGLITGFIPILYIFGMIGVLGLLIVLLMSINPHLRGNKEGATLASDRQSDEVSM